MGEFKELNDELVEGVSGGAGKTALGFIYDNNGTVHFSDKTGAQLNISAADWKWLLGHYSGTPRDKEVALASVPVRDVEAMLNEYHSPFK